MIKRICVAAGLLVLSLSMAFAQTSYIARQIDNKDGLSNSCINTVLQDADDLMWLGTWDGLNLYNGTSMHVFNYGSRKGQNYLASNIILNLQEDDKRNIWAGTIEGVSKINKQNGTLSNYFYSSQKVSSNGYVIAINNQGKVFAARRNTSTIYYYNAAADKFLACSIKGLRGMITDFKFDQQGNLWVQKNPASLELYRPEGHYFEKAPDVADVKDVAGIFMVNQQFFYTTGNGALYRAGALQQPIWCTQLPHEVRSITYYQHHYIFAWASKGIGEYTADFKPGNYFIQQQSSLANTRVTSLCAGKENILWVGTDGSGVIKIVQKPDYFGAVLRQTNGQPFSIPVRAFCKVHDELWVGTKGNGIIAVKNWGRPDMHLTGMRSFSAGEDLLDNCVYTIAKGTDGQVYIGSDAPGITLYNQATKKFTDWKDIAGSARYPAFSSVHCILYDRDSSVWLGLNSNGLVHLKIRQDAQHRPGIAYFKMYTYNEAGTGPANNVIYSLANGSNHTLWVGCRYGGLSLFNKLTQRFKQIKAFAYPGGLSNNDVLSLYIDKSHKLWVGTSYGLNWTDEPDATRQFQPRFNQLNSDNGLPNNTVHAITEDDARNIWISTNKGIAKVDPLNQKIVNFKQADGLQSDEFSDNAVWKADDGELYFGGIYGFNYFKPGSVQVNLHQPHLMLSNLQLAGKKINTNVIKVLDAGMPSPSGHYELSPQENYFEQKVEFISFVNPQKCQYSYRLQGNDVAWHPATHDQAIFYNNLAPGDYTLKIKWSNGEGGWTAPVTVYTITVKQYWWLSTWAFIIYALVIIVCGVVYYRYRKNKFLLRHQLAVEHMLREQEEKLHQEQLGFFTNIAHELQTPLTLILGALERYLYKRGQEPQKEKSGQFLSIVKHEAARLHYLVHQLLEFRKAESGHLQNHYSHLNVSALLQHITGLFAAVIEQKQLDYSAYIEPDINLWTDKDKLEKIIFNLMSNAVKHTQAGQYIILSVNRIPAEQKMELIVANSGCRLTEGQVNRLFDLYFTADDSQQTKISSGIGLAFTRQLVHKIEGTILATQENGWISFKVTLPLNFEPQSGSLLAGPAEQLEGSSLIFNSLLVPNEKWMQPATAESNKKAMLKSFEQEHKRTVLIVEDEQLIRYLLKDILGEQYIVFEAASGVEALEVISRNTPDLVISDIMMPDMDGLQLCRIIKETPASCDIPVVLLTARHTIEQKTEGYDSGADAYIAKPFQTEHLLVRVQKLIEYRDRLHKYMKSGKPISAITTASDVKENDKLFIENVATIIEQYIDEELDSAFLKNKLSISRMQLYRKIKSLAGMTPTELIRQVRLKKAAYYLETSDLTVSEIFYRTGFNNKTYFFREFKKVYHCSPNDYRAQYRLPRV
jgi:signal transduction histidine kinase/CheY-like chemotaxis protein/ligand-binding sensor domain-containing protein/AraC-like DNA-binding protein